MPKELERRGECRHIYAKQRSRSSVILLTIACEHSMIGVKCRGLEGWAGSEKKPRAKGCATWHAKGDTDYLPGVLLVQMPLPLPR